MSVCGRDYIISGGHRVVFSVALKYHSEFVCTQYIGSTAIAEELADIICEARTEYCLQLNTGWCLEVDVQDYIEENEIENNC